MRGLGEDEWQHVVRRLSVKAEDVLGDCLLERGAQDLGVVNCRHGSERAKLEPAVAQLRVRFPEQRERVRLVVAELLVLAGIACEERCTDQRTGERRVIEPRRSRDVLNERAVADLPGLADAARLVTLGVQTVQQIGAVLEPGF